MNNKYTAIIKQDGDWWLGWIEEISGVNCQEKSYSELLESLKITLQEALELNREEALLNAGSDYKKELIALPIGLPFNTENVLSFNIQDESNYELKKITLSLKRKLNKLLRDIRKSSNHKLLYRGDSVSNEVYDLFKGKNLGKFFLVGEKAKSNIENLDNEFSHSH
jgi:predicted RNase H-like HicB family nuclease